MRTIWIYAHDSAWGRNLNLFSLLNNHLVF
jgi:hypothetical protein